ncbi:RDD family protein [Cellulomonas edaphi]|uniref:RDD family protein n=1 Tax=Cellulomonas edaphi TaxID=3053468 RepID=A0ABT7S7F2_9CELL|nr:RDD family protein [Cellulomons edaphi]MDM7831537.1 RDD family protein [Cellulomons edaphi]
MSGRASMARPSVARRSVARPSMAPAPARVASLGRRFLAATLDTLVLLLAGTPLLLGRSAGPVVVVVGAALVLALVVLQWVWHGTRGWTLGRLVLGLRTVDVETLRPIGLGRVLVRGLVVAAGALVLGVGQLVVLVSPLFDATGRNRGWHDKAAGDEVVDLRDDELDQAPQWFDDAAAEVRATVPVAVAAQEPARRPPARLVAADAPVVPAWATASDPADAPTVTGSHPLVLAPLVPREHGPDVDTRAMPVVRVGARQRVETAAVETFRADDARADDARADGARAGVGRAGSVRTEGQAPPVVDAQLDADVDAGLDSFLEPEVEMTRRSAPRPEVAPEPEVVESPEPRTSAELALSDGRRVVVEGVALIGRNPSAVVDVQTIRVVDPGRSVSKTHLQVAVSPAGIWVADRGSTNGTVVTLPDGAQVVCPVDHPVRLRPGSTVTFGDYSFVVVRGPSPAA